LRFVVTGDPGVLSISPGPLPFMVSLDNAQQTAQVNGTAFMGVTINVDPQAPLSTTPMPLIISWVLAADTLHDAVSGVVQFNLRIVAPTPADLSFDIDSITFNDSTPANGDVHAVFRRDGSFNFHGHFHNSGAVDINYHLMAAVLDAQGNLYTMPHSGRVAGSLTPGLADDNWNEERRDDSISRNWVVLLEGGLQFKAIASATTDFAGLGPQALGVALDLPGVVSEIITLL
jgi:hypothetical protein